MTQIDKHLNLFKKIALLLSQKVIMPTDLIEAKEYNDFITDFKSTRDQ